VFSHPPSFSRAFPGLLFPSLSRDYQLEERRGARYSRCVNESSLLRERNFLRQSENDEEFITANISDSWRDNRHLIKGIGRALHIRTKRNSG